MPELPEVETIVRSLRPRLTGQLVLTTAFYAARVMRGAAEPDLAGHRILAVTRHGKHILLRFDHGTLAIHLGMTGKLLIDGEPTAYLRAEFVMDACRLLFDDVRQFGRMAWSESLPENVARLGPDALEISAEEFTARLRAKRGRVKAVLLNQAFVRGLGNIYVDEALFRAGIHPGAEAAALTRKRGTGLHRAIVEVLEEAISSGGSSISDYVDTEGRRGSFQDRHKVYGRGGEACVVCGSEIARVVLAQRGTHFCPRCQKM
ncbi:MAG TPA: bifunctional DNA-formamidopyrimidine glycosylase/DNA-(apurinic or apyrimidinic site) lyase [Bryobacteraceae bacterium]|nr:bifunctional DNA-formamidopyrimidine glycosylase/DNA-(apurinic or apyrimidinic site) lyase [Bryobacteraceae bacterium]